MVVVHDDLRDVLDQCDEELDVGENVETGEPSDAANDGDSDRGRDDECHNDKINSTCKGNKLSFSLHK